MRTKKLKILDYENFLPTCQRFYKRFVEDYKAVYNKTKSFLEYSETLTINFINRIKQNELYSKFKMAFLEIPKRPFLLYNLGTAENLKPIYKQPNLGWRQIK